MTARPWWPGSSPRHPSPRRERPPGPTRRSRGRGARSAPSSPGCVAGVCGVVVIRAVFGPRAVVAGAVVGAGGHVLAGVVALVGRCSTGHGSDRSPPGAGRPPAPRRAHPVAWFAPVVGSVVAMLAWAGVAHSSGSGWVQAVGRPAGRGADHRAGGPCVPGPSGHGHLHRLARPTAEAGRAARR